MSSTQVFDLFRRPRMDESIQKIEWRTYYPYIKSFRNNDVIEIAINQSHVFDATYDGLILITTVKLNIENVELKIKRIYPNDDIKLKLLKVIKADTPIVIPYRQWDLHMLPALTVGATKEIWAVKTTSSIESLKYVIVCFQTNRQDKMDNDPTYFDNINISYIRLTLNGESFPNKTMRLNFHKNDYIEAHYKYAEFYPSYMNCMQKYSLLDYDTFKNRALFVIDCSKEMKP